MEVSIETFKNGIARYADREIIQKLPVGTLKRVIVGSAIAIAMKNSFDSLLNCDIIGMLKIRNDDGKVDVELLRDTLKEQIPEDGVKVTIPGVDITMTFKPSDIDVIYHDIEEVNIQ